MKKKQAERLGEEQMQSLRNQRGNSGKLTHPLVARLLWRVPVLPSFSNLIPVLADPRRALHEIQYSAVQISAEAETIHSWLSSLMGRTRTHISGWSPLENSHGYNGRIRKPEQTQCNGSCTGT
jgi:hypothetical protein